MFTLLFLICMLGIFGKLLVFGLRAAWGVSKLLLTVVFFPVILIGMVFAGLIYLAFPILIIVGIVTLYKYITSPKEESIPLETTLEDAAELTTQKMIISDVFRSTKGTIPHCTYTRFIASASDGSRSDRTVKPIGGLDGASSISVNRSR